MQIVIGNLIGLTPYGRFGYGYEGNSRSVTIAVNDRLRYSVLRRQAVTRSFGLTMKVLPMVSTFSPKAVHNGAHSLPSVPERS
jgi:hypothetical protein